tara:strand:- start:183 stop:656 length:474 start_codon:yes stop_codon:yes gene_type:complete
MKKNMKKSVKVAFLALGASSILLVSACAPVKKTRGNMLKDYQVVQVEEGIDTRSDVIRKLGSPTTVAPFDENVWFYIGQKTEKKGIFAPEVVDERITLVQFDEMGAVRTVMDVDQDRMDIPLSGDKTPTGGLDVTVLQQLLGNLGKFNAPEASATDL